VERLQQASVGEVMAAAVWEVLVGPVNVVLGVPDGCIPALEQGLFRGELRSARRVPTGR
jgi:hypothetical protein